MDLVTWICPECGTENIDITDQMTHCATCGEVVWVGNEEGQFWPQGWKVDVEEA